MTKQDVDIARALNQDTVDEDAKRVEKGVARANAQVALIDVVTLLLAHMWTVLAAILAPIFAFLGQHGQRAVEHPTELGDKQS